MEGRADTGVEDWVFNSGVPVGHQDFHPLVNRSDCLKHSSLLPQSIIGSISSYPHSDGVVLAVQLELGIVMPIAGVVDKTDCAG